MDRYTLSRYGTPSINLSSSDITYTWRAGQYGGRIQQTGNPYDDLWWKFQKGTEGATGAGTGTLTLGTDNPNGTNYTLTHATAPWINTIYRIYGDATPQAGLARVAAFVAQGGKTNMANIHLGASSLASLFTAANGYTALSRFNGAGFDLTNVTSLASMFDGVSTLTQVTAVDHWTTGNVTSMAFMFRGCKNLESISTMRANATTGAWDVSKVTTFESMFENCERLGDLTAFADWNVHGAVNLANMFKNAKGTTDLDVSGWDTTGASSRADMFTGLTSLNRLGVGNKTVLVGTGFDAIATRQPALGSWDRSDHSWFGNISDLTVLYPVGGNTITLEVNGVHLSLIHI